MPMRYNRLIRRPPFLGLDLSKSDLIKDSKASSDGKNFIYNLDGTLTKAPGFVCATDSWVNYGISPQLPETEGTSTPAFGGLFETGIYGIITKKIANKYRAATDFQETELIVVSDILFSVKKTYFTLFYTGASSDTPWYSFLYNPLTAQYEFKAYLSGALQFTISCGDQLKGSSLTIANLEAQLSSVSADWSVGNITSSTVTAISIPTVRRQEFTDGYTNIPFYNITSIPTHANYNTLITPGRRQFVNFQSGYIYRNLTSGASVLGFDAFNFEGSQRLNRLYIAGNSNPLNVYDGYRAGAAGANANTSNQAPTTAIIAGPGFTAATGVKYKFSYEFPGPDGQVYESELSAATANLITANQRVTVAQPIENSYPFVQKFFDAGGFAATQSAAIAPLGFQSYKTPTIGVGVTTLRVTSYGGDEFHDILPGEFVYVGTNVGARRVVSVTVATITLESGVTTTAVTSVSRIGCKIWRTKDGGTDYYAVATVAAGVDSTTYTDAAADASLGAVYFTRELGTGYYVSSVCLHQDKVVTATGIRQYTIVRPNSALTATYSDNADPLTIFYSTNSGTEYFNISNSFTLPYTAGTFVSGMVSDNNRLVIFTNRSIYTVTGTLGLGNFEVQPLYKDIGCVAPNSIRSINGQILFLSDKGLMTLNGNEVSEIGSPINPNLLKDGVIKYLFDSNDFNQYRKTLSFATAGVDPIKQWYYLFIPNLRVKSNGPVAGFETQYLEYTTQAQGGTTFIYDFRNQSWYMLDNINAQGGFAYFDDKMWFASRKRAQDDNLAESRLFYVQNDLFAEYAVAHSDPILMEYKTAWEDAGDNRVFKMYPKLRVDAVDAIDNTQNFTLTVKTEKDYQPDEITQEFTMEFNDSDGYGEIEYGQAEYGSPEFTSRVHSLSNRKSKALRLIFSNDTIAETVQISGWEIDVTGQFTNTKKE